MAEIEYSSRGIIFDSVVLLAGTTSRTDEEVAAAIKTMAKILEAAPDMAARVAKLEAALRAANQMMEIEAVARRANYHVAIAEHWERQIANNLIALVGAEEDNDGR